MSATRRQSRQAHAGPLRIGGGAPVSVQSMVKAPPDDIDGILEQIRACAELGGSLMRLAVPNRRALGPLAEVRKRSPLPLVADIHFDERLAIGAIEAGVDKIRLNPGNLKHPEALVAVVAAAREHDVAIRVGVNSGSVRDRTAPDDGEEMARALVRKALAYVEEIEALGFRNLVLSLKASDAATTIAANLEAARACDLPLHLGVTAAGPEEESLLKSAIGVGGLLARGIGDTIRLSFTGPPAAEIRAGRQLLRAAGLLRDRVEIVSCPTCGRCKVDLPAMVRQVQERLCHLRAPLRVAVMGCEVNGPGEAAECDIGIAAGKGRYALFRGGELLRTVPEAEALEALCAEAERLAAAAPGGREAAAVPATENQTSEG
jgi:(E)-4-hydroxy-3-methylbut-2-enyl-diphosphate synthase